MGGLFSALTSAITAPVAALGSAGLGFLGSMITNSSNADNIASQEDFQENMADTTYQRTMADMSAAGLNPILAYSNTDPMAMGGVPQVQNVIANTVNSGWDAYSTMNDVANTQAQTKATTNTANISGLEGDITSDVNSALHSILGRAYPTTGTGKDLSDSSKNPPSLSDSIDNFNNWAQQQSQ